MFISQCLFSGDNPGVGIALDGRALGKWGFGGGAVVAGFGGAGGAGGVLLEPPERRSCRKHHLLGETEEEEGEGRGVGWKERREGVINAEQHI